MKLSAGWPGGYHGLSTHGGAAIRTLVTLLFLSGAIMVLLGVFRVGFAVRFWQRMQWLAWVYVAVMIVSAVRLWLSA